MELTQFELGVLFERLGLGKEEISLVFAGRENIEHVLEMLLEKHRLYTGIIKKEEPEEVEEEPIIPEEVEYVSSREVRELEEIASAEPNPEVKSMMQQTIAAAKEREVSELNKIPTSTDTVEDNIDKTMDERLDDLLGMTKPKGVTVNMKGSETDYKSNTIDQWVMSEPENKLDAVSSIEEAKPSETINTSVNAEDLFGKWGDNMAINPVAPVNTPIQNTSDINTSNNDIFFSNPWEVRK